VPRQGPRRRDDDEAGTGVREGDVERAGRYGERERARSASRRRGHPFVGFACRFDDGDRRRVGSAPAPSRRFRHGRTGFVAPCRWRACGPAPPARAIGPRGCISIMAAHEGHAEARRRWVKRNDGEAAASTADAVMPWTTEKTTSQTSRRPSNLLATPARTRRDAPRHFSRTTRLTGAHAAHQLGC